MPVYEYRCENGHTFEEVQRMSDDPIATCQICGAPVQRVFHPVAVHFKGSGFYATDYGRKKGSGRGASSDEAGGGSSDSGVKKDSDGAKPASAAKSESGGSSGAGSGSDSGSGSSD
jgi:putative FmdB family regulatory protein